MQFFFYKRKKTFKRSRREISVYSCTLHSFLRPINSRLVESRSVFRAQFSRGANIGDELASNFPHDGSDSKRFEASKEIWGFLRRESQPSRATGWRYRIPPNLGVDWRGRVIWWQRIRTSSSLAVHVSNSRVPYIGCIKFRGIWKFGVEFSHS